MMRESELKKVSKKQKEELALRRKLKAEMLEECDYTCMTCDNLYLDWRGLSMHHKKKLSQGGKTEKSNISILCGHCHDIAHGLIKKQNRRLEDG